MSTITATIVKIAHLEQTYPRDISFLVFDQRTIITLGQEENVSISKSISVKYRINEVGTKDKIYKFVEGGKIIVKNTVTGTCEEIDDTIIFKTNVFTKFIFPEKNKNEKLFGFEEIEKTLSKVFNDKEFLLIGLHGPSGIGKMAFLKKLSRDYTWKHFLWLDFNMSSEPGYINSIRDDIRIYKNVVLCIPRIHYFEKDILRQLYKMLRDIMDYRLLRIKVVYTCQNIETLNSDILSLTDIKIPVNLISGDAKVDYLKYVIESENKTCVFDQDFKNFALSLHGYSCSDIKCFVSSVITKFKDVSLENLIKSKEMGLYKPNSLLSVVAKTARLKWTDIGGYEDVKRLLIEKIQEPIIYNTKMAKGFVLYGPPGCSKSMFAIALATECNLNMFVVTPDNILGSLVGESEAKLRGILEIARNSAPSLIFIDEIDLILPRRGGSNNCIVSEGLLSELLLFLGGVETMSDQRVVFMAATNKIENLDEALIRPGRVDKLIKIDLPDQDSRESILRIVFSDADYDVDREVIESIPQIATALSGESGAAIVSRGENIKRLSMERRNAGKRAVVRLDHVTKEVPLAQDDISQQLEELSLQ